MFAKLNRKLRDFLDDIAPSPETRMLREVVATRQAYCMLLMEVARLEPTNAQQKRDLVAQVMREQFGMPDAELAATMSTADRSENRLTSYFEPVKLIKGGFDLPGKTRFVEQLWRVAMVDGDIDMYEDHLVRKLADLLYVPHKDFILAKNRVQARIATQLD